MFAERGARRRRRRYAGSKGNDTRAPAHRILAGTDEADRFIIADAFGQLMDHYTEDAVLTDKPGLDVLGREAGGQWRCCIDNSYGHRILD
jgi:ketosteroid isomerase-like protein